MGPEDFKPDQQQNIDELDAEALTILAKIAFNNYTTAVKAHTNYRLYDQENPPANDSEKQDRKDKLFALKRAEDRAKLEWDNLEQLVEEKNV
ncbi:MAG: hypothetical protein WD963_00435 [Candidatus Paceibacterota bacterium]